MIAMPSRRHLQRFIQLTSLLFAQCANPHAQKVVVKHKNFLCHDETERCVVGDEVAIESCQRVSKRKHFVVVDILKPAARFTDEDGVTYSAMTAPEKTRDRDYKTEIGWKLWQTKR